jgi:hypothetical protein
MPLDVGIVPRSPFPYAYRKAADGARMPKIDEAAVLKRAKELCDQNGTLWDYEPTPVRPGTKLKPTLDETGRQEYLARAREQLAREQRDA